MGCEIMHAPLRFLRFAFFAFCVFSSKPFVNILNYRPSVRCGIDFHTNEFVVHRRKISQLLLYKLWYVYIDKLNKRFLTPLSLNILNHFLPRFSSAVCVL